MTTMRSGRIRFPGALGDKLAARLDRPAGEPTAYVLFAHCFSCSKDLKSVGRISQSLVDRGFAVLRFDFTGLGESEGAFADTNFSSNVEDLVAAADYLRETYQAPRILIGHSLGGAAVLAAAHRVPEAVAVATIGAPSDTGHLREMIVRGAPELEHADEAEIRLGGRPFRIKRQLLDDLSEQTLGDAVGKLRRALLVMHSPVDETVGIEHARRIFDAAKHPKSFVSLPDADHLLLKSPEDARYVGDVLSAWSSRFLPDVKAEESANAHPGVVVQNSGEGLLTQVRAGRHDLVADEPTSVGGTDLGPTPYDFLLAALGTCTAMTLRLYAKRKSWPLEGVEVGLEHDRIHASDCADCETKEGRVDRIRRAITLTGDLDETQRERLLEIADRCPVHRTLTNEIKIETRSVDR